MFITAEHFNALEMTHVIENTFLKKQLIMLEEYSCRSNLLFHGIPEEQDEICQQVIKSLLEKKLGVQDAVGRIQPNRVHRVGYRKTGMSRPIIVQFPQIPQLAEVLFKNNVVKN